MCIQDRFLGPRIGKYGPDGKPRAIPGHNVGFAVVGVFVLWFGWFGFNAGSALAADVNAGMALLATHVAAATAALAEARQSRAYARAARW